jgi:hypothetical protein
MILTDEQFEKLYKLCENKWESREIIKTEYTLTDTIYNHPTSGYESIISDNIRIAINRHNDDFYTSIIDYNKDFLTPYPPCTYMVENGKDFAKRVFCGLDKKVKNCLKEKEDRIFDLLK